MFRKLETKPHGNNRSLL